MERESGRIPFVEPVAVPEFIVFGIYSVEEVSGCLRFTYYSERQVGRRLHHDPNVALVIPCELVIPAMCHAAKELGLSLMSSAPVAH